MTDAGQGVGELPDWAKVSHPDIKAVLAYWMEKRAGRTMPARVDIDPADLRRFLPYITLVDVVADERRFVYRLVGTMEVALRGRDPTGSSVIEGYFGRSVEDVLSNYESVCRSQAPYYELDDFQVVGRYVNEENLFLPLSDDGEQVNKIMVFSISRDLYAVRH